MHIEDHLSWLVGDDPTASKHRDAVAGLQCCGGGVGQAGTDKKLKKVMPFSGATHIAAVYTKQL